MIDIGAKNVLRKLENKVRIKLGVGNTLSLKFEMR